MHQAPEGLEYSHDNDKFAKADKKEKFLEAGKMKTGSTKMATHLEAAEKRAIDGGCCDPYHHGCK